MVEMGRFLWAPVAGLLTLALLALAASASLPAPEAPAVPGTPTPPDVPSVPPTPSSPATPELPSDEVVATVRDAYGGSRSTVRETLDPDEDPETRGASPPGQANPGAKAFPVPERPLQVVQEATRPVRELLPRDAIGTARGAAEQAGRLPQELLAPEPTGEEAAGPVPQSGTAASAPSMLAPTLIIAAAGAATAATFLGFWLAGSSGAVGSKAAAAAASRAGDLRRLLPFASPLFTRFERDTVLGHPRREALYALILQEPGISLQALGDASGLSRTAVIHHLRLMEQQHLIVSRRVGRSRHYFENGGRYGHDQKEAYAILQNDRSKAVAEFIKGHPGAMQKALCEALGIQPSIAHWHVRRLEEARIVETMRKGRTVAYFPGPGLTAMDATAASQSAAAAPA